MMQTWMQRWQALSERERRLLLVGGGALLLAFVYWGLWQPFQTGLAESRARVASQQATLAWMQEQGGRVLSLQRQGGAKVDLSGSLESVVNQSASRAKITLTRMQSLSGQVQVEIERLPIDRWLEWVRQLEEQYGITVAALELAALPEIKGEVKVRRLVLERRS